MDTAGQVIRSLDGIEHAVNLTNLDLRVRPELAPVADTFITESAALGGVNSRHGDDRTLVLSGASGARSAPFFRFDLARFAGQTVTEDVVFQVYLANSGAAAAQTVNLRQSTSNWNEDTTFANIPGGGPFGSINPVALDSRQINYSPTANPARYVSFTIPRAIVQNWIDNPATIAVSYWSSPTLQPATICSSRIATLQIRRG